MNYTLDAQETVTDIDGNIYKTVTIGNQIWMAENLRTTRYRNGDLIETTNPATKNISGESNPKYQWIFEDNHSDLPIYGRLYTWYAVTDSRNIAPNGWHVPTSEEWTILATYLGGDSLAGGKLKETGTTHWKSPNKGATNESGFTALPGGCRPENGIFDGGGVYVGDKHHYGGWWCSSEKNEHAAWNRYLSYQDDALGSFDSTYRYDDKKWGFSVRCIKDNPTNVEVSKTDFQNPSQIKLLQNYPNPFNPMTRIDYKLNDDFHVNITIYNVAGEKIRTLVDGRQTVGYHQITWDAKNDFIQLVSSGVYFYQLKCNGQVRSRQMTYLK